MIDLLFDPHLTNNGGTVAGSLQTHNKQTQIFRVFAEEEDQACRPPGPGRLQQGECFEV